ncbi:MAG: cyclodeaminase/cyclohydrolase family protein [Chloroflexi bacterium]|nr:cyclodeaminase/cyclohydrolase family protein [Chloroflexota bacterium]
MTQPASADASVASFLASLAAHTSSPGGGAAAALAGATGAALLSMVCHYSLGREDLVAWQEQIAMTLGRAESSRPRLLAIVDHDATAFQQVATAYALPRATKDERAARKQTIATALAGAAEPPLAVGELVAPLVSEARALFGRVNHNLVSDLGAAGAFFETALRTAQFNVVENVRGLGQDQRGATIAARWRELTARAFQDLATLRQSLDDELRLPSLDAESGTVP